MRLEDINFVGVEECEYSEKPIKKNIDINPNMKVRSWD